MKAEAPKFSMFFLKFKEKTCGLRDNKTKPDIENASI